MASMRTLMDVHCVLSGGDTGYDTAGCCRRQSTLAQ
jgi:hypothetical protein